MKECSQCREVKPLEEFYARKRGKDGRRSECKKCFQVRRGPKKRVPNTVLREAFLGSGITTCELARLLGHERLREGRWLTADDSHVVRALGLKRYRSHGKWIMQASMEEGTALRYANALGLAPYEIGL